MPRGGVCARAAALVARAGASASLTLTPPVSLLPPVLVQNGSFFYPKRVGFRQTAVYTAILGERDMKKYHHVPAEVSLGMCVSRLPSCRTALPARPRAPTPSAARRRVALCGLGHTPCEGAVDACGRCHVPPLAVGSRRRRRCAVCGRPPCCLALPAATTHGFKPVPGVAGSDRGVATSTVRDAYTSSANLQERQRCELAPMAGNPTSNLKKKKESTFTEKRVIYPPGGPAHVALAANYGAADENAPPLSTTQQELQAAVASPNRRRSLSTQPAGRPCLVSDSVRSQRVWHPRTYSVSTCREGCE